MISHTYGTNYFKIIYSIKLNGTISGTYGMLADIVPVDMVGGRGTV